MAAHTVNIVLFAITWVAFLVFVVLSAVAVRFTYTVVTPASSRLRVATTAVVTANVAYIIVFSINNAPQLRKEVELSVRDTLRDRVALEVIRRLSIVFVAALCDALVAWRFYVIFQRQSWALCGATAVVALTTATGIASAVVQGVTTAQSTYAWGLSQYVDTSDSANHDAVYRASWALKTAWTWMLVITNVALTLLIIGKILWTARQADGAWTRTRAGRPQYRTITRAFIESAFLSWLDIVIYAGFNFSSPVHADVSIVKTASDITFFCMPPIMGISQCLIIIRLGRAKKREQEGGRVLNEAVIPASPAVQSEKHPFSPITPTSTTALTMETR